MKTSILFSLLLLSTNCFAEYSASRGYIMENNGMTFFAGLNDRNIDTQLQLSHFTAEQEELMYQCIQNKYQYAILVESGTNAIKSPTGIPGRSSTFHAPEVYQVSCVRAPGFINHWREFFKATGN